MSEEKQNFTVPLPKRLLRQLKIVAAERDTSVTALLTATLEDIVRRDEAYDEAMNEEFRLMERGILRVGDITWTRDEVHER